MEIHPIKEKVKQVAVGAAVLGFLIFGFYLFFFSSVSATWFGPEEPVMYSINGADGRDLSLIMTPGNYVYLHFANNREGYSEAALTRFRGTKGSHIFWRLWKLNGPGDRGLFDYRLYPSHVEPWTFEIEYLGNLSSPDKSKKFPPAGRKTRSTILVGEEEIRFEGMWLQRADVDDSLLGLLESRLQK